MHIVSRFNLPLFICIRNLFTNKKHFLLSIATFSVAILISVLAINLYFPFQRLSNKESLRSFIASDNAFVSDATLLYKPGITPEAHSAILKKLRSNSDVRNIYIKKYVGSFFWLEYKEDDTKTSFFVIYFEKENGLEYQKYIENTYDPKSPELRGRHPRARGEIAISSDLGSRENSTLSITLNGKKREFTITGIFQNNFFNVPTIICSIEDELFFQDATYPTYYYIDLDNPAKINAFMTWADNIADTNAVMFAGDYDLEYDIFLRSRYSFSYTILAVLMIISFLILAFLGVYNETLLFTIEYRKNFGILKTLGMTPGQLCMPLVWKGLIQMGIALFLSIPLGNLLTPSIILLFAPGSKYSFSLQTINLPATLALIPLFLGLSVLFAWLPSRYIAKQRPGAMLVWNRQDEK